MPANGRQCDRAWREVLGDLEEAFQAFALHTPSAVGHCSQQHDQIPATCQPSVRPVDHTGKKAMAWPTDCPA